MDLWVDANAPVRRVKIEPQVGIDGDWVTYPMEVRVMEAGGAGISGCRSGGREPARGHARIFVRDEDASARRPRPDRRGFAFPQRPTGRGARARGLRCRCAMN